MPTRSPPSDTSSTTLERSAPQLGVAIATFRSERIIEGCLDSLLASQAEIKRVVIADNASPDATRQVIRDWAAQNAAKVSFIEINAGEIEKADAIPQESWLVLVRSPVNGGFAHATNRSIEALLQDDQIDLFWVLNPDCRVAPGTASAFRKAGAQQDFALMGGRTVYDEHRDTIQTDGGRVSRWTGVCRSVNGGQLLASAPVPDASSLDYITGANCVASRLFIERAGLMVEDYFLYYEEVDWAFRRGDLPLVLVPDALTWHIGGTAIGSGSMQRRPTAFANYFNARNRMRFVRRFNRAAVIPSLLHALAKSAQLVLLGNMSEARALLAGALELAPPSEVAQALSPEARAMAFAPMAPGS